MLSPTQNFVSSIAIIPQTVSTTGVYNCASVDLINIVGGESILGFIMFSGARTGGDYTVQDFQMSKVSNFASDVITLDSTSIEHFLPQDSNSALNALAQTKIETSSAIKKLGIHLPKNVNEYRYGRIRLFGANTPSILLGAVYLFKAASKPI